MTPHDRQFIDAIRAVVAETGPGYRYEHSNSIGYVRYGRPDCLIARALARIGVPVSELAMHEGTAAHAVMPLVGRFSQAVYVAASIAQRMQDYGFTWGEALDSFEKELAEAGVMA